MNKSNFNQLQNDLQKNLDLIYSAYSNGNKLDVLEYIWDFVVGVSNIVDQGLNSKKSLENITSIQIVNDFLSFDKIEKISKLNKSKNMLVRAYAYQNVAWIQNEPKAIKLIEKLPYIQSNEEKIRVLFVASKYNEKKYLPILADYINDSSYKIRIATSNLLMELLTSRNKSKIIKIIKRRLDIEKQYAVKESFKNILEELGSLS